jgi:Spy/CpxP family protein refolding chaperone
VTGVTRTVVAMLALTVLAAGAGGYFGVRYGLQRVRSSSSLDELVHRQLKLNADQEQRLVAMESTFAARRKGLEDEMRSANRELASAVLTEHRYGPQAEQAIEHFHAAMKTLQEETIKHVMAMRSVLTPQQAQQFDLTVAKALNSDQP